MKIPTSIEIKQRKEIETLKENLKKARIARDNYRHNKNYYKKRYNDEINIKEFLRKTINHLEILNENRKSKINRMENEIKILKDDNNYSNYKKTYLGKKIKENQDTIQRLKYKNFKIFCICCVLAFLGQCLGMLIPYFLNF